MAGPLQKKLDAQSRHKERLIAGGQLHWFHWAIILASLFLTLTAWRVASQANATSVQNRFDREVTQVVSLISERMEKYEDALWAGVATLSTSEDALTVNEWRDYSEALDIGKKYPGINGIGVIDFVPRDNLQDYLDLQHKARPDFKIFPEHQKDELWPISYLEPIESNAAAIGLDMAHEANRYEAAIKARNTGRAQITAPIKLVQDEKRTPGFLFYAPHYNAKNLTTEAQRKAQFVNLVYAPFIFNRLMGGTLETDQRLISLKITDGADVLYDELSNSDAEALNQSFKQDLTMDIYGRQWRFEIRSNAAFAKETSNNKPWVVLLMGLLIEAMIIYFFYRLARSNRGAVKFASEMSQAHEEKAEQLENVMNNAIDGIILSDGDDNIISFNKAAVDLFGYRSDEIIGKSFYSLCPDLKSDFTDRHKIDAIAPNPDVLKKFFHGHQREVTGQHKDGSKSELEISISIVVDQGETIHNIIVRDIFRRKQAEAKLQKTMKDLIHSNEDLEKFAYVASHDLKSPLRAIDNLSKWIYEDLKPVMDEENAERLQLLRGRVSRLGNLLTSLLSYSQAGQKFEAKDFMRASDLLSDVIKLQNIPEGFTVEQKGPLDRVMISRMPLEHIFHNLISNAIKHHDKETGHITISGRTAAENFIFEISDDGPGIDPAMHDKIFEMFQTLRPRDQLEATGMGLALVKKMVLRHDGEIDISSDVGKGSKFTLIWPIKSPAEHHLEAA